MLDTLEERSVFWILGERRNKAFFVMYRRLLTNKSKSKGLEALEEALIIVGVECPAASIAIVLLSLC